MEELYAFIANNIEYPEAAKRLNISGKVKVEFIVDKDGTVKNPVVVIRNNFPTYCKKLKIF